MLSSRIWTILAVIGIVLSVGVFVFYKNSQAKGPQEAFCQRMHITDEAACEAAWLKRSS